MTPAERKAAAEVMASNGPWQYRNRKSTLARNDVWFDMLCEPDWDWFTKEYRVTPQKIVRYVNLYRNQTAENKIDFGASFHSRAEGI